MFKKSTEYFIYIPDRMCIDCPARNAETNHCNIPIHRADSSIRYLHLSDGAKCRHTRESWGNDSGPLDKTENV